MKNNFKLMTYAEMAEFIFNMDENKVYSFTTAWTQDGDGLDECLDTFWYGIVKHRLFDTTVITMGYFGGGSVNSFDYEYDDSLEEIEQKFTNYINFYTEGCIVDGSVMLDTEPCQLRKENKTMEFKIGKTYTFSPADYNAEKDEAHKKEYGYSEYDMIDKDGYVICMVGESVTLVDTDDSFVVLFNDNNGATKETFKISKEKFNRDFCINSVD